MAEEEKSEEQSGKVNGDTEARTEDFLESLLIDAFKGKGFQKISDLLQEREIEPPQKYSESLLNQLDKALRRELDKNEFQNASLLLKCIQLYLKSDLEEGTSLFIEQGLIDSLRIINSSSQVLTDSFNFYLVSWFERARAFVILIDPNEDKFLMFLLEEFFDSALVICKCSNEGKKELVNFFLPELGNLAREESICCALRQEALRTLNSILGSISREERKKFPLSEEMCSLSKDLAKTILEAGDYDLQVALSEALCRLMTKKWRDDLVHHWFEDNYLAEAFKEIKDREFETDCRKFLNQLNERLGNERRVYSFPCISAFADVNEVKKPSDEKLEKFWIDFNLGSQSVTFYVDSNEGTLWDSVRLSKEAVNHYNLKEVDGEKVVKIYMKVPIILNKIEATKIKISFSAEFEILDILKKVLGDEQIMINVDEEESVNNGKKATQNETGACGAPTGRRSICEPVKAQNGKEKCVFAYSKNLLTLLDTPVIPESTSSQDGGKDASSLENVGSLSDNTASQHSQQPTGTVPQKAVSSDDTVLTVNLQADVEDANQGSGVWECPRGGLFEENGQQSKQETVKGHNLSPWESVGPQSDKDVRELIEVGCFKMKRLDAANSWGKNGKNCELFHLFEEEKDVFGSVILLPLVLPLKMSASFLQEALALFFGLPVLSLLRKGGYIVTEAKGKILGQKFSSQSERNYEMGNKNEESNKLERRRRSNYRKHVFSESNNENTSTGQSEKSWILDSQKQSLPKSLDYSRKRPRVRSKLKDILSGTVIKKPKFSTLETINLSPVYKPRRVFDSVEKEEEIQTGQGLEYDMDDHSFPKMVHEDFGDSGVVTAFESFVSQLKQLFWSRYKKMESSTLNTLKTSEKNVSALLNQIHECRLSKLETFQKIVVEELASLEKETQVLANMEKDAVVRMTSQVQPCALPKIQSVDSAFGETAKSFAGTIQDTTYEHPVKAVENNVFVVPSD
ncbi:synaptonemal complex protein 2-like [Calypte anna]|uniref:synaptonemal complex protein 2-like n=1 Tax=Calypte anna TaxID=9244 RepID=UPI0011C3EBBD|nr:synaptonemal complex protein 2-like [Calypte anna]